MTSSHTPVQARGRIGGLRRAALAPSRQEITRAARDARWQKYIDRIKDELPWLTEQAEIERRAELLRKADLTAMSLKAVKAKRLKAELRAVEAELSAEGLLDAGSDGADIDA